MLDLHGKVVLITGASRGLGFAMAEEFAWEGARLVEDKEHVLVSERHEPLGFSIRTADSA